MSNQFALKTVEVLSLLKRLQNFQIDQWRYRTETKALTQKGYTNIQSDRVIIRKSSKNSV